MNSRLPDDFRDEIAKKQRQEIQRLRRENAELREQAQKPRLVRYRGRLLFLSVGEGELGIGRFDIGGVCRDSLCESIDRSRELINRLRSNIVTLDDSFVALRDSIDRRAESLNLASKNIDILTERICLIGEPKTLSKAFPTMESIKVRTQPYSDRNSII